MEKHLGKRNLSNNNSRMGKSAELLVDVYEKDEVAELAYDIPNIINIPLSVFEDRFNDSQTCCTQTNEK